MSQDRTIDGLTETVLLWVLVSLAYRTVDKETVARVFGVPPAFVTTMLTLADLRGQATVAHANLVLDQVPPMVIVRGDDVAALLRAVQAWVPRDVLASTPGLADTCERTTEFVRPAGVWTNN